MLLGTPPQGERSKGLKKKIQKHPSKRSLRPFLTVLAVLSAQNNSPPRPSISQSISLSAGQMPQLCDPFLKPPLQTGDSLLCRLFIPHGVYYYYFGPIL